MSSTPGTRGGWNSSWYDRPLGGNVLCGMFPETLCGMRDLERWNHRPQILLTRRLSSMANSTTESRGSFLLSSITSSFSAWPIVLEKIDHFMRMEPFKDLGKPSRRNPFLHSGLSKLSDTMRNTNSSETSFPCKKKHYTL